MKRSITPRATFRSLAGLLALGLVCPTVVTAQQQSRQRDGDQRDRQRSDRLNIDREGWVHVGVDRDSDGRFDSIETIYLYDLERARERSRQRAVQQPRQRRQDRSGRAEQRRRQDQSNRADQRRRQGRDQRNAMRRGQRGDQRRQTAMRRGQQQDHQVSGQLRNVLTVGSADGRGELLVGRIKTDQGRTARVALGPKSDLQPLDLQQGMQVEVTGRPGRINDRMVLIAHQVNAEGQTVRPQYQKRRPVQQLRGEVVNTRTVRFKGHDRPFVVGDMRLQDGQRVLVNFGPKQKLGDAQLQQADEIRLLARQGRISGEQAWIAEQIRYQGKTIRVGPDQRRDRRWRSSRPSR